MSLGCARCGDCCSPVKIDFGVWARAVANARSLGATDIAVENRGYWADAIFLASRCRPVGAADGQVLLECASWDGDHSRCVDYDGRPPVCRGFPWYGRGPETAIEVIELRCSYLLDVPPAGRREGSRPLIPLAVVGR